MNKKISIKKNQNLLKYLNKTQMPTTLWLTSKGYSINKKGQISKISKKQTGGDRNNSLNILKSIDIPVSITNLSSVIENNKLKKYIKKNEQNGGSLIQNINALSVPVILWLVSEGLNLDNNNNLIYQKKKNNLNKSLKNSKSQLGGNTASLMYNLNKLAVPVVLWLIANGLEMDSTGKINKSPKVNLKNKQSAGSILHHVNKLSVPIVLWLISRGLEIDNLGQLIPLRSDAKKQSGGTILQNINKLSVPVILWLISEFLDQKKSRINNNLDIKNKMHKLIGGGSGLWTNIAELLLIPGIYILCSIGLKNLSDSGNTIEEKLFVNQKDEDNFFENKDNKKKIEMEDEDNEELGDVNSMNEEKEIREKINDEQSGGFIRGGSPQNFTYYDNGF